MCAWVGGILLALRFYQPLAAYLTERTKWSEAWSEPFAFMLIALVTGLAINVAGNVLLRRLLVAGQDKTTNRILGVFPGLVNGLVTAAVLAALLPALPLPSSVATAVRATIRDSALANRLATHIEGVENTLSPVFSGAIEETLDLLTIQTESDERVDLPYTVRNSRARPDLEAQMLALVNRERASANLAPLTSDPELVGIARSHSADMFARGYFAHITPEGRDPFDRMREASLTFITAGENLAHAPTLTLAHDGLMNSPGHRANILRSEFTRIGIGIMDGGVRGLMITQNFRD